MEIEKRNTFAGCYLYYNLLLLLFDTVKLRNLQYRFENL